MPLLPLGVVVVNWNGAPDTIRCLESLVAADPGPAHTVVVDNGSTDGSVAVLSRWIAGLPVAVASRIALLPAPGNRGFAAGANLGIERLSADAGLGHFLLLNNDATVRGDFFAQLALALHAVPDAAIVGVTIYATDRAGGEGGGGGGAVWYAGGTFQTLRVVTVHHRKVPEDETAVATDFVTGCAMLVSRRARAMLGPLPECYFMYLEDAEYSYRARAAGMPVVYAPRAVVHHSVGAAVGRLVPRARFTYWVTRGRALFARRNLHGWRRWGALSYLAATKPARALVETLAGRPAVAWAILRGTAEGLLSGKDQLVSGAGSPSPAAQDAGDRVVAHQ